jgi:hypothetical protein
VRTTYRNRGKPAAYGGIGLGDPDNIGMSLLAHAREYATAADGSPPPSRASNLPRRGKHSRAGLLSRGEHPSRPASPRATERLSSKARSVQDRSEQSLGGEHEARDGHGGGWRLQCRRPRSTPRPRQPMAATPTGN